MNNYYNKISLKTLKKLLKKNSIELETKLDININFNKINSIDKSESEDLTFFHNSKYLDKLKNTKAKACLIEKKYLSYLNNNCTPIIVNDPYLVYALISNILSYEDMSNGEIHKSSLICDDVLIENNVQINANVVVKNKSHINKNVIIYENSVIGPNVLIGQGTRIMSNCVISNTHLGENCLIQHGSIIGSKGFGFTPKQKINIKHNGNVIIGNNVDIGSNTTIDRGTINSTIIKDNCRIDNLVQIAHNVEIGKDTIIAAQTGIAGSTIIGNNCIMGGQVGIAGHLNIGNNVIIAAKSGVTKNIQDNSTIAGFPALDIKKWKKSIIGQYKNIK